MRGAGTTTAIGTVPSPQAWVTTQATSKSGKSRELKANRFCQGFCKCGFVDAGHGVCAAYDRDVALLLAAKKRQPRLVTNTPFRLAVNTYHIRMTIVVMAACVGPATPCLPRQHRRESLRASVRFVCTWQAC